MCIRDSSGPLTSGIRPNPPSLPPLLSPSPPLPGPRPATSSQLLSPQHVRVQSPSVQPRLQKGPGPLSSPPPPSPTPPHSAHLASTTRPSLSLMKPLSVQNLSGPGGFLQPATLTVPDVQVSGTLRSAIGGKTPFPNPQSHGIPMIISHPGHGSVIQVTQTSPPGVSPGVPLGVPAGVSLGVPLGVPPRVSLGAPPGILPGIPPGVSLGVPPGVSLGPPGILPGIPPGVSLGVPPGVSLGLPPGVSTSLPLGAPIGIPPGAPLGVPLGASIGVPPPGVLPGVPTGMLPGVSLGLPPGMGVPPGVLPGVAPLVSNVAGNLPSYSEATVQKAFSTSVWSAPVVVSQTRVTNEPVLKKRGRPRRFPPQEKDSVPHRGRSCKHNISEGDAPSNQGTGASGESSRTTARLRRSVNVPSTRGTMKVITHSNKISGKHMAATSSHHVPGEQMATTSSHQVPDKHMAATSSHQVPGEQMTGAHSHWIPGKTIVSAIPAGDKVTVTRPATTTSLSSSTVPISVPTVATLSALSVLQDSSNAVSTLTTSNTLARDDEVVNESTGATNDKELVESESLTKDVSETDQNLPAGDLDSLPTAPLTSPEVSMEDDAEDPLSGLKSKNTQQEEVAVDQDLGKEEQRPPPSEDEKREENVLPVSPELIEPEDDGRNDVISKGDANLEVQGSSENVKEVEEMGGDDGRNEVGESKSHSNSSIQTGTESLELDSAHILDSKSTTLNETESSKVNISGNAAKPSTGSSESNRGKGERKSLSLRRHSTPDTAVNMATSGGEGEDTTEARRLSLVDTPTNGKGGGILKHTSQFDTPSTAKVGGVCVCVCV